MSSTGRGLAGLMLAATLLVTAPAQAESLYTFGLITQAELATLVSRAQEAPYSAETQFELAIAYARTPFPERAWAALDKLSRLDPDYAARVIERYSAQVEAKPADLEARFRLAVGLFFRGHKAEARRQLQLIVARAPKSAWALTYLGWIQAEAMQTDAAMATWTKALAIDPDNAVAHWLIGQAHFRKGRSRFAAIELKAAQDLRLAHPLAAE